MEELHPGGALFERRCYVFVYSDLVIVFVWVDSHADDRLCLL